MKIWHRTPTLNMCEQMNLGLDQKGTLMRALNIQITEVFDDSLVAEVKITPDLLNPVGLVHGGVNVVLAETVASYAANFTVDLTKFFCVGQEISASHLRPCASGTLKAIASPLHLGNSSSVWEVKIYDNQQKMTCLARMTACKLKVSSSMLAALSTHPLYQTLG